MTSEPRRESLALPLVLLVAAFAAFCSVPFFLARESREQARMVAERRSREEAAAAATRITYSALDGSLVFRDVERQSREFMGYYHTIALTPEQEAVKARVLEAMPAACCNGSTAYTCCCPCNLSKTIWGLSNYLIARRDANATQLSQAIHAWMSFTNGNGYTGEACYKGGCDRGFSQGGCGGMEEEKLAV